VVTPCDPQRNRAGELTERGGQQLLSVIQRSGKPQLVRTAAEVPARETGRVRRLVRVPSGRTKNGSCSHNNPGMAVQCTYGSRPNKEICRVLLESQTRWLGGTAWTMINSREPAREPTDAHYDSD
jgi:hypothetical protein